MKFIDPQTGKEQNAETFDLGEAEMPGLPFVGVTGVAPVEALAQIPDEAARKPAGEAPSFDPVSDLAFIRHSFPFVPIMLYPQRVFTVGLDGVNPQSLDSAETTIIKVVGIGDWYMAVGNNAAVPAGTGKSDSNSLYRPSDFFYARGISKLSFHAPQAGFVQVMCWNTNRWPEKGRGQ